MTAANLPRHVAAFIASHIRSLEDLQLLMAFVDESDRWWDADTVARELQMTHRDAGLALEHFARHNLLEIRVTTDVRYRFRPGTDDLRAAAVEAIAAYRANPIAVIRTVSPGMRSIRDFADAFRIKRNDR